MIIMSEHGQERCRHWWIYCGKQIRNGKYEIEYRCDICGRVEYMPDPDVKTSGVAVRHRRRGRKGEGE